MIRDRAHAYFREFMASVPGDVTAFASRKKQLILPTIPINFVVNLTEEVTNIIKNESSLLDIKSPVTVAGDLHGHLLDLFRILKTFGSPEARQYLFLGDIVDRGEFSVETIILIYIMKVVWPKKVYIIRGNHEFGYLCSQCGFFSQVSECYGDIRVFRSFLKSFGYLPLGALIDGKTLCVHGGLSPSLYSITQIRNIQRPFDNFGEDDVIDGILWSDPKTEVRNFEDSPRGTGYFFGKEAVDEFMNANKLKYIVRGHECVTEGTSIAFGCVITVFSASHYCGIVHNDAAVLNFKPDFSFDVKVLPEMDYLLRNYTMFVKEKQGTLRRNKEPQSARVSEPKTRVTDALPRLKGKTPRIAVTNHPTTNVTKRHAKVHNPNLGPTKFHSSPKRKAWL